MTNTRTVRFTLLSIALTGFLAALKGDGSVAATAPGDHVAAPGDVQLVPS